MDMVALVRVLELWRLGPHKGHRSYWIDHTGPLGDGPHKVRVSVEWEDGTLWDTDHFEGQLTLESVIEMLMVGRAA